MTRPAKSEPASRPGAKRRTSAALPRTAAKSGMGGRPSQRARASNGGAWRQKADALKGELRELRRQQRATSDVLRAISSSPSDLQSVLKAVANNAARLCDAQDVLILRVAGDVLQIVAHSGKIPTTPMGTTFPFIARTVANRTVQTRQAVHVKDIAELKAAMVKAREATTTQAIVIDTTHTRVTADGGCWWEVAIPEVSERAEVREAHQRYVGAKTAQRP